MRVLVAVASRHGATSEIAEAIGAELRRSAARDQPAAQVDVRAIGTIADVEDYDAVVIGSAVYLGRWLKTARNFVTAQAGSLRGRPVWLFSSGPVGSASQPGLELAAIDALVQSCGAREHQLFAGRLRATDLNAAERLAVRAVHADQGDFRDWAGIGRWARAIAADLAGSTPLPG